MKHEREKAVKKFKIDLIVWKYMGSLCQIIRVEKFKIDLIVWKSCFSSAIFEEYGSLK